MTASSVPSVVPASTYRIQVQPRFTFADAAAWVPYLAALGVTHLHLSPVLEAVPGSTHGYDVVDHTRVRAELGGEQGLRELSARARAHGMGLVLDVVPNHMAVPAPEHLNGPLWEVLRDGPDSRYADWFDIDWAARGGRVLLPVLGEPLPDVLGELAVVTDKRAERARGHAVADQVERSGPGERGAQGGAAGGGGKVLAYYEHRFPLRPGTEDLPLPELVAAQHYELAYWRTARTDLNYRRFFTISDLIAVRVERPEVFEATHATVLRLLRDGVADGLRIDHPDGLADPEGYLRQLAAASGGRWTVVEKILQRGEELPAGWACAGTTGYDALDRIDGLFTDPVGAAEVADFYREFTGVPDDLGGRWRPTVRRAAYNVVTRELAAEVSRLARSAHRAQRTGQAGAAGQAGQAGGAAAKVSPELPEGGPYVRADDTDTGPYTAPYAPEILDEALRELLVRVPVYRSYVRPGAPAAERDVTMLTRAAEEAAADRGRPLAPVLAMLRDLALGRTGAAGCAPGPDADDFLVRFPQVASALHAKSVEDAAFYRYGPLLSLCEVGRDPGEPAVSPGEFHASCALLQRTRPGTGTVLSTHDTKRSADLRLRLAVLSERPAAWRDWLAGVSVRAGEDRAAAPDRHTEYTVHQTAIGLGSCDPDRLLPAALKSVREAGLHTTWTEQDAAYEQAVTDFTREGPCGARQDDVRAFAAELEPYAVANSLGAALLHLTVPGVPDVFQGTEFPVRTLVDPDNRGPLSAPEPGTVRGDVDRTLERVLGGAGARHPDEEKLRLTATALRLRRDHPEWYGPRSDYAPLTADGPAAAHCVAFVRGGGALTVVTRLSLRLAESGGWRETVLPLPPGRWHDRLGGGTHEGAVPLAGLLASSPVALLTREPGPEETRG
ncbi:maltooligosyl trehalose synthase [Actinacidiphila yanglinensis]|uniref:Maltooligosyl trehalose synthase n=1 Tax=Actinacidiphila yanglinensis TaxID=310779 RepID=A0A1H5XDI3_9ACTN|nr:alpha-amylase family glycosyl hydrolase [Actinacidiphila yanglinensis]SEG09490.1 maltooligosyl trehalose synthase [Actinacidiphila yanglinensis]